MTEVILSVLISCIDVLVWWYSCWQNYSNLCK